MEKQTLTFGITGEFLTKIAREWYFIEHKPYSVVEELLLSCLTGTDTPTGKLKLMIQDILLGRSELRGNSWDGTFGYVELDGPAPVNLVEEYAKICNQLGESELERKKVTERHLALVDALRYWIEGSIEDALDVVKEHHGINDLVIDLLNMTGDITVDIYPGGLRKVHIPDAAEVEIERESTGSPMLDSFFKQLDIEKKHPDSYGWLEPDGTFNPVPWCEHQDFAFRTIRERGWWDDYKNTDDSCDYSMCGDYLTRKRGWVLLHNPGQGVAIVTRNESRPLTRAQREFLFDYYSDRKMPDKAKMYLEEGE